MAPTLEDAVRIFVDGPKRTVDRTIFEMWLVPGPAQFPLDVTKAALREYTVAVVDRAIRYYKAPTAERDRSEDPEIRGHAKAVACRFSP